MTPEHNPSEILEQAFRKAFPAGGEKTGAVALCIAYTPNPEKDGTGTLCYGVHGSPRGIANLLCNANEECEDIARIVKLGSVLIEANDKNNPMAGLLQAMLSSRNEE